MKHTVITENKLRNMISESIQNYLVNEGFFSRFKKSNEPQQPQQQPEPEAPKKSSEEVEVEFMADKGYRIYKHLDPDTFKYLKNTGAIKIYSECASYVYWASMEGVGGCFFSAFTGNVYVK